jgi:hypothetical protein
MAEYVRPRLEIPAYLDADETPIPYGDRWESPLGPPDEAYSVTAHRERFAPVVTVAHALVEHLHATYDVAVDWEASIPAWMPAAIPGTPSATVRTTVVTPVDSQCSPLTLVETGFPGVFLGAGVRGQEAFPDCGCDACDDDITRLLDSLEEHVFAVVNGQFEERLTWRDVGRQWSFPEGMSGSRTPRRLVDGSEIAALKRLRRTHPRGWQSWPLREAN